jgi:sugar lactone lactonase YvrE
MRRLGSWGVSVLLALGGCGASRTAPPPVTESAPAPAAQATGPTAWQAPEVLVKPSSFHGVHGLAIDAQGRLLAGTVVGSEMWEVDRQTGAAHVFIGAPEGEADDIAIGPKGELAWTSFTQGQVHIRDRDDAPIRTLAKDLMGINGIAFDKKTGKLYASQVFYGDALWEIDLAGGAPRLIAKDLGGFNGFEVGPDGQLYGPLWFKGQVVKINPKNGKVTVVNAEFKTPASANLDGKGNLWVLDTFTGELSKVELKTGKKTVLQTLQSSLDNLAFAPDGTLYVSNMADNSVQVVDPTGASVKTLTGGELAAPAGIKLEGDTLYVADVFAFRAVNTQTGEVRDVQRAYASQLAHPAAVGVGGKLIALSTWSSNNIQLLDRATLADVEVLKDFQVPMDAIPLEDGSLLVIELAKGTLVRASGEHYADRKVVASELAGPTQMILGKDGGVYITEAIGRLTRVDLQLGTKTVVADQLAMPEGLAETPWGSFVVAESATRRLVSIDPVQKTRVVVAENLPIGLPGRKELPPPYLTTGVAVGPEGTVYVTCDRDGSLLRIRPQL